ncbi:MAG: O-antigen polymerase, partial [Promethearchaeota archaeon]
MNKTIEDAKLFDYDKFLIIILPIISLLLFIFVNEEIALLFGLVISSILVYELIIYNERFIYGFNGLRILSFPSLLLFSYTIFISIPSIFVITKTTNEIENMYFFSIFSFYILFPIGLLTSKYLWDINIDKISKMYYMKIKKSEYDHIFYKLLIHLLILCFALLFLYLIRIKKIPLLEMIKNPKSYAYMWALREEAFKLLEVNIIEKYLYSWNRDLFYPLGIVGSLFLCILYKENKYKVLFIIFLVTGLINNAITTAKAPVAQIFLSLISFYFLKEGKIKFKYIVLGLLLIFAFPIVIYYFTTNPLLRNTETILNALFYRVFLAPADVLYQYYKIFPSMHEFLLGRSTKLFSWLFEDGT